MLSCHLPRGNGDSARSLLNTVCASTSLCRLWERCGSFFDLICWLLEGLSLEQQQVYSVDVAGLLDSEITLMEELCKYTGPSECREGREGGASGGVARGEGIVQVVCLEGVYDVHGVHGRGV